MDYGNYIRFVAALIFVLGLIALATWLAKRFGIGTRSGPMRGAPRRLRVVEIATVDAKHRAVLLRRDDTEHLVLIGGATDIVIESGIAANDDASTATPNPVPKDKPEES